MAKAVERPKLTLEEFKAKLQEGGFKDLGQTFNEQLQTSFTARAFQRLKFSPRIAKFLFVPTVLSFPFDPLTGEVGEGEDGYNMRRRFRPMERPDDFLMNIKALCNEDDALKKKYMDYAGFTGKWDTKQTAQFTDNDREILFIYRRTMAASKPAININDIAISGSQYGGKFLVNVKQDQLTGEYLGDPTPLHRLGLLSGELQRTEIKSFDNAIVEGVADCISLRLGRSFITSKTFTEVKDKTSNAAKTIRGQIRGSYPLGSVSPVTVVPAIWLDVSRNGGLTHYVPDVNDPDGAEIEQLMPQFRNKIPFESSLVATDKFQVIDKINEIIGNYFPKDPSKKVARNVDADVYANFCILEYITDSEIESFDNDQDRNQVAMKMEAKKERTPLYNRKTKKYLREGVEEFIENLSEFYDYIAMDNFAQRMPELMMSTYSVATDAIEERALSVFAEKFNLGEENKELFNSDIIAKHKSIIMDLWPEDFADRFDQIEDKIEDGEAAFEKLLEESADADQVNDEEKDEVPAIEVDEIQI